MMPNNLDLEKRPAESEGLKTKGVTDDNEYGGFPVFRAGCLGIIALVVIVVIVIIAAAVSTSGSKETKTGTTRGTGTTTTEKKDNEAALVVGQNAKAEGIGVTILQIVDPFTSSNMFSKPADGTRFVAFKLRIENVSDKNQSFNISNFQLLDAASGQHELASGAVFDEISLVDAPSSLVGGANFEGWVAFEVSVGVGLKDLMYDPNPLTTTDIHFRAP